jgi:hypothetical protein
VGISPLGAKVRLPGKRADDGVASYSLENGEKVYTVKITAASPEQIDHCIAEIQEFLQTHGQSD